MTTQIAILPAKTITTEEAYKLIWDGADHHNLIKEAIQTTIFMIDEHNASIRHLDFDPQIKESLRCLLAYHLRESADYDLSDTEDKMIDHDWIMEGHGDGPLSLLANNAIAYMKMTLETRENQWTPEGNEIISYTLPDSLLPWREVFLNLLAAGIERTRLALGEPMSTYMPVNLGRTAAGITNESLNNDSNNALRGALAKDPDHIVIEAGTIDDKHLPVLNSIVESGRALTVVGSKALFNGKVGWG